MDQKAAGERRPVSLYKPLPPLPQSARPARATWPVTGESSQYNFSGRTNRFRYETVTEECDHMDDSANFNHIGHARVVNLEGEHDSGPSNAFSRSEYRTSRNSVPRVIPIPDTSYKSGDEPIARVVPKLEVRFESVPQEIPYEVLAANQSVHDDEPLPRSSPKPEVGSNSIPPELPYEQLATQQFVPYNDLLRHWHMREKRPDSSDTESLEEDLAREHLTGRYLHLVILGLCLCLFVSNLEITIVSTALVSITDDLKDFEQSSWIVTGYLVPYCGFMIIWAKLSDILGRRLCILTTTFLFMLFSGACGVAQTMVQLIVFRAFQGLSASGIVSITFTILSELGPPEGFSKLTAIFAAVFAVSYVLGPTLGGFIVDNTTWRWVFLLNPPAGLVGMILVFLGMPAGFPHSLARKDNHNFVSKDIFTRLDFVGTSLLLFATAFLVTGLQEAGISYAWNSGFVITFLVGSAFFATSFLAWAKFISHRKSCREPILPWKLLTLRIHVGILLVTFLAGAPFTVAIINIPERYQTVNGLSASQAGLKLIPFSVFVSVGSALSSIFCNRLRIPPIFVVLFGAILQTAGLALLSTLPVEISAYNYGYEILTSVGIGLNATVLILLQGNIVRGKLTSVSAGALWQFRALGGVVGLAIATNVLNTHLTNTLTGVLPADVLAALEQSTAAVQLLSPELQQVVQTVFKDGYNLQMRVMTTFGGAQILAVAIFWEKKLRRIA